MFIQEKGKDEISAVKGIPDVTDTLKPGLYKVDFKVDGWGELKAINLKEYNPYARLNAIEYGIYNQVRSLIKDFASPEMTEACEAMNSIKKMGIVLHGRPGTGKTSFAGQMISEYVKSHEAVGLIINQTVNPLYITQLIDTIREGLDEDNLVFAVLDEFEKTFGKKYGSSELLSFLDGVDSRNNVITITTANNLNDLPDTLTERPGRFEHFFKFDIKDEGVMTSVVDSMIPKDYKESIDGKALAKRILTESKEKKKNKLGLNKKSVENPTIDDIRIYIRNEIYKVKTDKELESFLEEIV